MLHKQLHAAPYNVMQYILIYHYIRRYPSATLSITKYCFLKYLLTNGIICRIILFERQLGDAFYALSQKGKGVHMMKFPVAATLLDACVLGVLAQEATYGYDLTQKIQGTIDISESTLYPVLRRLLKDEILSTYDESFDGRNRRYYKITHKGEQTLQDYIAAWQTHKAHIEQLLLGGQSGE